VRPWQPRNLPYPVSQTRLKAFIQTHVTSFDEIVYLGWVRRLEEGKRVVKFLVATGPTRLIAKQRFKEGNITDGQLWEITPSTQSVPQPSLGPA
jgi:hypothetical protein